MNTPLMHQTAQRFHTIVTGEDMRRFRQKWEMTQVEFAEVLGMHPQTVSKMERSDTSITQTVSNLLWAEDALRDMAMIVESLAQTCADITAEKQRRVAAHSKTRVVVQEGSW